MVRRMLWVVVLIALVPTCAQGAGFLGAIGDYFEDRTNDLMDIFWLQGGAAATYKTGGAHLRISKFWQLGYIRFEGYKVGMEGRAFFWPIREKKVQRGTVFVCPDTEIHQDPLCVYRAEKSKRPVIRNGWFKGDDGREQPWSIGLEVALPPSSLDIDMGICPEQIFDFLLGFFTLDPLADDRVGSLEEDPTLWFKQNEDWPKKKESD